MRSSPSRLKALFEQCAELPEAEAFSWIERQVNDAALRHELALMLVEDRRKSGPLDRSIGQRFDALCATEDGPGSEECMAPQGTRFGEFEVVRPLGSGGQGNVYLARRAANDFEQFAALKLLHSGPRSQAMIERFRRERQILARLQHAGLARLIDGGVQSGIPYLIMEYIDGEPIDAYCERTQCSLARRLDLIRELCEAVAAAHRALVVHRDLKPSNILVNGDGHVKVLDFGIAKLLDESADDASQIRMLTPGYGSPEQVSGEPITLASDVYSLGVILRQLVAGQRPPPRIRGVWHSWPRGVPREVRWIFDKSTAENPDSRYRDSLEFSEDLERYRRLQPVRAHPPSGWYRTRKFVARHRGGVTISAILVLTTVIGFGIALWQMKVARHEAAQAIREKARADSVKAFVVDLLEATSPGKSEKNRPDIPTLVYNASEKLALKFPDQPETRIEVMTTLGMVLFDMYDEKRAFRLLEQAESESREFVPGSKLEALTRLNLARAYVMMDDPGNARPRIALLLETPAAHLPDGVSPSRILKLAMVEAQLERRFDDVRRLAAQVSQGYQRECQKGLGCDDLSSVANDVGASMHGAGDFASAETLLASAVQQRRKSDEDLPGLATSLMYLSDVQRSMGRLGASESSVREAMRIIELLGNSLTRPPDLRPRLFRVLLLQEQAELALEVANAYRGDHAQSAGGCDDLDMITGMAEAQLLRGAPELAHKTIDAGLESAKTCSAIEIASARLVRSRAMARSGGLDESRVEFDRLAAIDSSTFREFVPPRYHFEKTLLLLGNEVGRREMIRDRIRAYLDALDASGVPHGAPDYLELAQILQCGAQDDADRKRIDDRKATTAALAVLDPYPVAKRLRTLVASDGCG